MVISWQKRWIKQRKFKEAESMWVDRYEVLEETEKRRCHHTLLLLSTALNVVFKIK